MRTGINLKERKIVRIGSIGGVYSTYEAMAEKLGADFWSRGKSPKVGDLAIIENWAPHMRDETTMVVLIRLVADGRQFLISSNCLLDLGTKNLTGNCVSIWEMSMAKDGGVV